MREILERISTAVVKGDAENIGMLTESALAKNVSPKDILDSGVNAVWPGCDIWPTVPRENMQALIAATYKHGTRA